MFHPRVYDPRVFNTGTHADFETRLEGLYVDWVGAWRYGVDVEADTLKESINGVRSALTVVIADWKRLSF